MPGERTNNGRWGKAPRLTMLAMLLLLAVVTIAMNALAEDPRTPHEPIRIVGDGEMDIFFEDQDGDGLSWETAYLLADLEIDLGESKDGIRLMTTSRHVVIRNCLLSSTTATTDNTGLTLDLSSNVTIEDCIIRGTGSGVSVADCQNISVISTSISKMVAYGIHVQGTSDMYVKDATVSDSKTPIVVVRSWDPVLEDVKAQNNQMGFDIKGIEGGTIEGCDISWNEDIGLNIEGARNLQVMDNTISFNQRDGLWLHLSFNTTIHENDIVNNRRGIYLNGCGSCMVDDNNIRFNDMGGILLSGTSATHVMNNDLRSNWNRGIDLQRSDDNIIEGNTIYSHERGIMLASSQDNEIIGNKVMGNWFFGIDGDLDGNTIRDNDMRANGWLRGLLFLFLGLIILGGVLGTYFWAKRRKQSKVEKGKILIKTRFPPGAKSLWPMSRVMWDEDFFKAQLATAGPQREDILRRYQKNIAAAKQMQYMAVGTMSVMLGFMAYLPLIGVMNVATTDVTADNVNDVLFASSMSIAVYYLMSFMILLVFGLLFTSQLMKGDIFKLLSTLPMDNKGARRIVAYLLFRMYGPPLVVVLLAFPVGGFLITWSFPFLAMALLVNALYLIFVTYVLVLIADATSRKIFSANASRGATAMRFLIMAGYLMAMMFMFITLDFLSSYISDLFLADRLAGGSGESISMGMSVIPFPFAGSYLISMSLVPGDLVSISIISTTLVGVALMVGVVYQMRRTVNRILNRVARGVEHAAGGPGQVTTAEDITIRTRRPRPALMRNGLLVTSRDQGAIMYIIMPLLFPIIFILPGADRAGAGIYDAVLPFLFYMGMMPFLVNMSLSSADATVGGLLGSLPLRVLDHYRAKWVTIIMIIVIPVVVITVAMYNIVDEPAKMVALMASLVPMLMVLASVYLLTFSLAFGTVNGKNTFFMTNIRKKLAKYVGIIVLQYVIVIVELGAFYFLTEDGIISFWMGIVALWAGNIALLVALEVTARRTFD